jgi:hypothetical protein
VVIRAHKSLTTLGRLTFPHENGLSYNALGPFHPPLNVMLLSSSIMSCMYMAGEPLAKPSEVIWSPSTCQVSDLHVQLLVHIKYPARRWTAFNDIGPSPCGRAGHAMAFDGRRVFVLGGELSPGAQVEEAKLIHVLDTSMYFPFVISFRQPPILKTQSTSVTRYPTPTLSTLMRRPRNSCGSRQRSPRPYDNHIRRLLRRMLMQHMVLLLLRKLPQKKCPDERRR